MQLDRNEKQLLEILDRSIREMEKVEDDPATMTFVARRVGNIVRHMKDLREDLRPRGIPNANSQNKSDRVKPHESSQSIS